MADFGLIRSFDIDGDELQGLSPQQCFVLGYELAQVDAIIESGGGCADKIIHQENRSRIERYCTVKGVECETSWMHNDPSESWCSLTILPAAR